MQIKHVVAHTSPAPTQPLYRAVTAETPISVQQQDGTYAEINQPRIGKPSRTSHMDAGPSSCSARMLTVADMRADSHTFYPWQGGSLA